MGFGDLRRISKKTIHCAPFVFDTFFSFYGYSQRKVSLRHSVASTVISML